MIDKVKKLCHGCSCGKEHTLLTSVCEISEEAAPLMNRYLTENGYKKAAVICDENTVRFARPLAAAISTDCIFILPGNAHATEVYTALTDKFLTECDADIAVACGAGSVHDITRYAAFEKKIPFISYPTAASVDGFVSGVAAMTWYGQKLTFPSAPPSAVFADPNVFSDAPARLTASGAGDVYGKYTSLFDWKVSNILTGEHYCEEIAALEYDALDAVTAVVHNRENISVKEYTVKVMEALLLSGLAMQLMGNSRPASGAEHHMSHLWEMHCINKETDALHGEKVSVGLMCVVRKYSEWLKDGIFPVFTNEMLGKYFAAENLKGVFGSLTEGIIRENLPKGGSSLTKITENGIARSALVKEAFKTIPSCEELNALLEKAEVPNRLSDINLPENEDFLRKSLHYAPYVRDRLSLLKIISASESV